MARREVEKKSHGIIMIDVATSYHDSRFFCGIFFRYNLNMIVLAARKMETLFGVEF